MSAPLLETRGLCRTFGALAAARDIDFRLEAGARHALIGPNGAGKTTLVNLLSGLIAPTSGEVLLKGRDVTRVAQAARVKLGIARTFQINRLFRGLSVLENVYLSVAERVGAAPSMIRPAGLRRDVVEESMHLLETLKLLHTLGPLPGRDLVTLDARQKLCGRHQKLSSTALTTDRATSRLRRSIPTSLSSK